MHGPVSVNEDDHDFLVNRLIDSQAGVINLVLNTCATVHFAFVDGCGFEDLQDDDNIRILPDGINFFPDEHPGTKPIFVPIEWHGDWFAVGLQVD